MKYSSQLIVWKYEIRCTREENQQTNDGWKKVKLIVGIKI